MAEFNLLKSVPRIKRDVSARLNDKSNNRAIANQFGEAYFDGTREQGYGGYYYDGRWCEIAATAKQQYKLSAADKVLDIGCAKGFFVDDLMNTVPGLQAYGLDISNYALEQAKPSIADKLRQGSAVLLPYADNSFDAVFAINTLHNLGRGDCIKALKEINRVCKNPERCFVQVDAYRSAEEKTLFEAWMLTAKTYGSPADWQDIFNEAGYRGDYFWTIIEFDEVLQS